MCRLQRKVQRLQQMQEDAAAFAKPLNLLSICKGGWPVIPSLFLQRDVHCLFGAGASRCFSESRCERRLLPRDEHAADQNHAVDFNRLKC